MRFGAGAVALLVLICGGSLAAQQKKKPDPPSAHPIKDIMIKTHKEKGALIFLVRDMEASEDDVKKLLEVYKQLNMLKPPTGDPKGWTNRTGAIISALQDLVDKKPDAKRATDKVFQLTDCKGCHDAHRVGGNSGK